MHIFNTHSTTAHNSTCSLLNIIPSKNFALLPPIWQLTNCSPLEIKCLVDTKIPGQQWWRCLQIKPASPQKFLEVRTKGNHKEQSSGCMQDVQGFPSPSPAANSWCHDSDEVSHYLKENDDTILQQVWSFERRTGHTLSCNTTAQYVSLTEVSGGTAWCNTSSLGEKNTTYITFRAPLLFLCNFLHADTAEYHSAIWHFSSDHVSAATVYPLSKCKQGMLLQHWKYTLTNITHVACWSSFGMHGIHFEQTFLLPTCFSRMLNTLTVDIPMSAAIAFVLCCRLPQAQHQHAPRLSSVMAAGAPLQAASITSSPHHKWCSSTSKQFHMMWHDWPALHAWDHDTLMLIS